MNVYILIADGKTRVFKTLYNALVAGDETFEYCGYEKHAVASHIETYGYWWNDSENNLCMKELEE